jgi:hypothetical protein
VITCWHNTAYVDETSIAIQVGNHCTFACFTAALLLWGFCAGSTAAHWRQGNSARVASKPAGAAAAAADLGLRSQSFTNGYQSPSQLFEVR